jgi:hypothetical protein
MSLVGYMIAATQERHGVKLKHRRTKKQDRAILDFIKDSMNG